VPDDELLAIHRELVARNDLSRAGLPAGHARLGRRPRLRLSRPETTPPTLVLFTQSKPGLADSPAAKTGMKVISIPDIRWARRDIKTVQLLYPSMGKMMAKAAGR
jgi:D-alanine transaminase